MSKAPKLRFKEFSGDWEVSKGNELFTILGGAAFSSKDAKSEGVKWFKIANVGINTTDKKEISYLSSNLLEEYSRYILNKGDITIALTRPILNSKLKVCIVDDFFNGSLLNQRVGKLIIKDNANKKFIYYLIQTEGNIRYLENMIAGTDPPNLSNNDLLMREYNVPFKEEQEKIASFFSLIDEKISLQGEKVEALKDYKRGMMQKIFSRELRFKDDEGRDYPEWEEKKLGDCIENKGGTALEKFVDENGTHKFISIGNYSTSGKYIDSGQRISLNDKTKDKLLYKNDLVMVLNDKTATGDLIGSTILIDEDNTYIYNQRSERLICNENINPDFAWILLNYEDFRKRVFSIAQGGTQIYVNFPSVKNLNIQLPSLKEQNKISELILALDNKIEKEQEKLDSLNEYKKGLLQQMFV